MMEFWIVIAALRWQLLFLFLFTISAAVVVSAAERRDR